MLGTVAKRSAGTAASDRVTTASSSTETACRACRIEGTGFIKRFVTMACAVGPV